MLRKYIWIIVCIVITTFVLSSCDKENNDSNEPGYEDVPSLSNPMVGKTIRFIEKTNSNYMIINTNFSIQFISATKYIQKLRQTADEQDISTGEWNRIQDLDKTIEGTYTYSSSKIVLTSNDGAVKTLTKVPDGWKDGQYVYN